MAEKGGNLVKITIVLENGENLVKIDQSGYCKSDLDKLHTNMQPNTRTKLICRFSQKNKITTGSKMAADGPKIGIFEGPFFICIGL